MASPLETYMKKMQRNNALTNVSLPGGVMVYDKDAERQKIESEYLANSKTPAQAEFKVMNSPSRSARMSRQQNQAMDNKIVQEGMLMNQFDMARGLGGREGIQKIKEIAESTPGGVSIFNKMNEGNITFNELITGGLGNAPEPPSGPSDTDKMQLENLIKQGLMPDDIKANPAMAKVYDSSIKLQAMAEGNLDRFNRAEERQFESDQRSRAIAQRQAMEQAAYKDEMMKDKTFYAPGLDADNMNLIAKNYVKYGDDNVLNMASALMGEYETKNKGGGMLGYLNMRSKLKEHGASEDQLKKFDDYGHSARIKELERQAPQMKSMQELLAERAGDPMEIKKVESKYNLPEKKQSKLREGMLKANLGGRRFAQALTGNQDWKKYVQEGGFISSLGNFGKGIYDRYIGNPIAAGKTENIMAEQGVDSAQAKHLRDVEGQGKADFYDVAGRGLNQAGRDVATGAGAIAGGVAALPGLIGTGLEKGYEGLTKNKASYEDVASGKERGSLLQRLGKGMAFAGNVVDVFNAPDPSQAMGQVDIKFSPGKGKEKVAQIDLGETDVNKDLEVSEPIDNPATENTLLEETNVQKKVDNAMSDVPYPEMTDEMDARKKQELMVKAGIDIGQSGENKDGIDGNFGPKSQAGWKEYTDMIESGNYTTDEDGRLVYNFSGDPPPPVEYDYSRRIPFAKQQGGFISELMKYQRGGLV